MICRKVSDEKPEIFLAKMDEVRCKIEKRANKNGKESYWLEDYEVFKDKWDKIDEGNKNLV